MLTRTEITRIAHAQSAIDGNCSPDAFTRHTPVVTESAAHPDARVYLDLPMRLGLTSYGSNVVAQTDAELAPMVRTFLERHPPMRCFETPALLELNDRLIPHGLKVCFMAEFFLPEPDLLTQIPCPLDLRTLGSKDFADLYTPEWPNALCHTRRHLDVLGVGAYDHGRLVAFAACSADCATMYQIGVDVLPDYRGRGLATALVSALTHQILALGKVPFYCAAWSNLPSVRTALRVGYRPAWVTLTAKDTAYVDRLHAPAEVG